MADIELLIFAWISLSRTSWPKTGVLKVKLAKGWCDVDPKELVFTFEVLTSVPILVKIDQEMRP